MFPSRVSVAVQLTVWNWNEKSLAFLSWDLRCSAVSSSRRKSFRPFQLIGCRPLVRTTGIPAETRTAATFLSPISRNFTSEMRLFVSNSEKRRNQSAHLPVTNRVGSERSRSTAFACASVGMANLGNVIRSVRQGDLNEGDRGEIRQQRPEAMHREPLSHLFARDRAVHALGDLRLFPRRLQ